MSAVSAETTVRTILRRIREQFNGLEDEPVKEFYKIMISEVKAFEGAIRQELVESGQAGGAEATKKPGIKRVNNYTMFGNQFRKDHPEIDTKKMFKSIAAAWKKVSKKDKASWKDKADEVNRQREEEYVEKWGSLPPKGKQRTKARTTNAFQQYVADFRKQNPDVDHREVFTQAGAKWKGMNTKQRKKYVDRAEKLKAEYSEEWERMKAENPALAEAAAASKKGRKTKEEKPSTRTGYLLFGQHWRKELNDNELSGKEAMKAIGAAWKALSKKETDKFNTRAESQNKDIVATFMKEHPDAPWTLRQQAKVDA